MSCWANYTTNQAGCSGPLDAKCFANTNQFGWGSPFTCVPMVTLPPAYLAFQYMVMGASIWETVFFTLPVLWRARSKWNTPIWILLVVALISMWVTTASGIIAGSDLFSATFPVDGPKNTQVMGFFWMLFQIAFIIPVSIRTNSLFNSQRHRTVRYGMNFVVALDIIYSAIVEFVGLRMNTINLRDMFPFLQNIVIPMAKANIAVEVVTDMILSFAFLYRLGEGMSASSRDMFIMFTNPKVLRLLFGWFLGIAYAATGQLYLNAIFMAWQLHTFAAFSFEEVKSIVRRHSEHISSGRKPSTHSQDKERESGNLGSVTTIARKASEVQLAPATGRKGSLIEVRKGATLDRKTAVMEEGEENV